MNTDQYSTALTSHGEDDDEDSAAAAAAFVQNMHGPTDNGGFVGTHADFRQADMNIDPTLNGRGGMHQHQHQDPRGHQHGHRQRHHQQHEQVDTHGGYADAQMQQHLYAPPSSHAGQFSLHTPSENLSESTSSHYQSVSPAPLPPKTIVPAFAPQDRAMPDKNVSDETLDDAYVAFILYCNPSVSLDIDTTDLRKQFRSPPKSDGKTFNVFTLFKLIEKFESKEVKTWTKLAIELGVERTAESSAQKVQQYAVRLKRWMHAMHVDAFFQFLLSRPHPYYQQIPRLGQEITDAFRERAGVPIEEDLALRALHPETRPKRGRRKCDDQGGDADSVSDKEIPPVKRQHLDTTAVTLNGANDMNYVTYPDSAAGIERYLVDEAVTQDAWVAAQHRILNTGTTPTTAHSFRWRSYGKLDTPNPNNSNNNHHLSTPRSSHPSSNPFTPHPDDLATPITATTPSSTKPPRRRRHGPAVSSAWPGSSNPLTGKLRGRPPQNRTTRDGSFSTFPANPNPSPKSSTAGPAETPAPTPIITTAPRFPQPAASGGRSTFRPGLHLTVPQQQHRPITMASSVQDHTHSHINGLIPHHGSHPWIVPSPLPTTSHSFTETTIRPSSSSAQSLEQAQQALEIAIIQSVMSNTTMKLLGGMEEAKDIARAAFTQLRKNNPEALEEKIDALSGGSQWQGLRIRKVEKAKRVGEQGMVLNGNGMGGHFSGMEEVGEDEDEDGEDEEEDSDEDAESDESENHRRSRSRTATGSGSDNASRRKRGAKRYYLRWETELGPIRGVMEMDVAVPSNNGYGVSSEEEGEGDKYELGMEMGVDEMRKKMKILEAKVKSKDAEMRVLKEAVVGAVVGHRKGGKENWNPNGMSGMGTGFGGGMRPGHNGQGHGGSHVR